VVQDIFDELTASEQNAPETDATFAETIQADPADLTSTPQAIKKCCQELLKFGLLEMERKPHLYQTALIQQDAVRKVLEPFDLDLYLDDIRGLAYIRVAEMSINDEAGDEWTHPLVRRQRLTLEQSLLVAILRKWFLNHEQEAGIGAGAATVFVDDLIPELKIYLGELGSDAKEQLRLRNLLEKLKGHGMVSEIDNQDQVTIRPLIAHLANPENLQALLVQYQRVVNGQKGSV
jgi:hypothetical protein